MTNANHLTDAELDALLAELEGGAPPQEPPARLNNIYTNMHPVDRVERPRMLQTPPQIFDAPLREEVDLSKAQQIYENWPRAFAASGSTADSADAFAAFERFYNAKRSGSRVVEYKFPKSCTSGRRYAQSPSLQGLAGWIADTIGGDIYYKIDQKNSRPTIAAALCRAIGFDYPVLQDYVDHRAECLARWVGTKLSNGKTLASAAEAKTYFLTVFGGSPVTSDNAELTAHAKTAARLHRVVWDLPSAAPHHKAATKRYVSEDWDNKYASCFTRVCDDAENGIIVEIQRRCAELGVEIGTLKFDEVCVYREGVPDVGALVADLEAHLAAVFGFAMRLAVKDADRAIDLTDFPPAQEPAQERLPAQLDQFDSLTDCEVVGDNALRTYNSQVVPDDGVGDIYLSSNCGTGKNVFAVGVVAAAYAREPGTTVISISPRKTLTYQTLNDLREACPTVTSYQNISGAIDLKKNPCVICQLDSIGRFVAEAAPDILHLDEISATISHALLGGNPQQLTKLKKLVAGAGRVLVTDADLTDNHVAILRKWRAGTAGAALARVYRNVFQPWAGRPFEILEGRAAEEQITARLLAFVATASARRAAGEEFASCVVPCHARKTAEKLAALIGGLYPEYPAVKLYTGETDDHLKVADFRDVEAAWTTGARPYAIIYTGTVSVGVSCNSPLVRECFAYFCSGNAAVPQSVQMMFRARQITKFTVAYTGRASGAPQTPAGVAEWLTLAHNRSEIPATLRDDLAVAVEDVYGRTTTDPAALLRVLRATFEGGLFLGDILERYRSAAAFTARLAANLERAGLVRREDPFENRVADVKDQLARAQVAARAADCARVAAPESLNAAREAIEMGAAEGSPLSAAEKAGKRLLFLANSYKIDPNEVTAEWVDRLEPAVEGFNRLKRQLAGTALPAGPVDVGSPQEAGKLLTDLAAVAGIDLASERPTFAADRLDPATNPAVRPLFDRINADALRVLGDTHGKRRAKVGPSRRPVVAAFDAVLRYYAGELEAEYPNDRARKQGTPTGYAVVFPWVDQPAGGLPALAPKPAHPRAREPVAGFETEAAQEQQEGVWEQIPGGGGFRLVRAGI